MSLFSLIPANMKVLKIALIAASAHSAAACDLCAIYSANQAHAEIGRGPFAGLAEQYTYFGSVQQDGDRVGNPSGQYLHSAISQLFVGYNLNRTMGIQFTAPIIYRYYKRPDGAGGIEHGTEAGLGDVSLLGNFLAYRLSQLERTFNWTLMGGVKFPTGNTGRIKEEFSEVQNPVGPPSGIHGHDLTLGSGSYDGIVGTSVYGRWRRFFATANVQYFIRTTGDFDYRFANELIWSLAPGYYAVLDERYTVTFQVVASGEYKGKDKFQGETADDTGMTAVYLGPEVGFTWHENLSAQVGLDLPVMLQNTSFQSVPDFRIHAGITWRF